MHARAREFIHPAIGEKGTAIGGHYAFTKEARLALDGRTVSVVEPIDESAQASVAAALKAGEGVTQVPFLTTDGDRKVLF